MVACVRLAEACHYAAAAQAYGIPEPADALRQYATEEALIR